MDKIKVCRKHGEYVPTKAGRCRTCMVEAVKRRRVKVKRMALEYKGGKCEKCGYDKFPEVLEFHHRDPIEKEFTISSKNHAKSWDLVKIELDKCDLLCANCHREVHIELKR